MGKYSTYSIVHISFLFICFDFPRQRSHIPINPISNKFVQRGFTERAAIDERIPYVGRRFTVHKTKIV
jgi:hypothetical protein